ncbi:MAG: hypothetical protein FJ279_25255, partial [Planctomycetes bacterium]|nr:hypothetical protein [Planctomycetota bacterium]
MAVDDGAKIHETDFCAQVAGWAQQVLDAQPGLPFIAVRIEGLGPKSKKRTDLRFIDRGGKIVLCGEVKLPGTLEGHSPYNDDLVKDAATKADNLGCRYFFTWNVNRLVLFDRQKYDVPPLDRRIKDWSLGLQLSKPADVGRPDVLAYVRDKFLPGFLSEFAEIFLERKPDWGMPPDDIFIKSLESHLEWPMLLTRDWLAVESERDRTFSL